MDQESVLHALARLRAAADQTRWSWPVMRWSSGAEPNSRTFDLDGHGYFADLAFEPGRDLVLRCRLNLPAEIAGISVDGEPLQLTIFSIYPMDLSWNGQAIFEEQGVPVAAGPALVQVIPSLRAGDNGERSMRTSPRHAKRAAIYRFWRRWLGPAVLAAAVSAAGGAHAQGRAAAGPGPAPSPARARPARFRAPRSRARHDPRAPP